MIDEIVRKIYEEDQRYFLVVYSSSIDISNILVSTCMHANATTFISINQHNYVERLRQGSRDRKLPESTLTNF